ncbi:MAG: hypothetical protein LBD67_01350 [Candidatus Accumulibacter sp.]|jgi:hypothetical protein|nr:hypothetical protein [Accumulibacter sp.]
MSSENNGKGDFYDKPKFKWNLPMFIAFYCLPVLAQTPDIATSTPDTGIVNYRPSEFQEVAATLLFST